MSGLDAGVDADFTLSTDVAAGTEQTMPRPTRASSPTPPATPARRANQRQKVDKKAPSVICDAADGLWHADNVSIACTSSDGGSGLADNADATFYLTTSVAADTEDGASTGSHDVYDGVNHKSTGGPVTGVKVDRKAPGLTDSGPTTNPNASGWYNTAVTNTFAASDGGSGLKSPCAAAFTKTSGSQEGAAVKIASGSCEDNVGNNNPGIDSAAFKIDTTKPSVTVTGVTNGATYMLGQVPAAGCSTGDDGGSGVKTNATLSSSGGPVGSVTATCGGAEDVAGNTNGAAVTYDVIYAWAGFFQPIDNNGIYNGVNAGRTIPAKFSLGGDQGLNILTSGSPTSTQVACPSSAPIDTLEESSTATVSGLKYDPVAKPVHLQLGDAEVLRRHLPPFVSHAGRRHDA